MHFDLADLRLFIHIAESPSLTQGARRLPFPGRRQRGSRRSKASLAAACCIATAAASN